MIRIRLLILVIVSIIFLTGCWDMIDIDQRAFPYSIGLDLNDEGEERLQVTFTQPNINAIGDQTLEDELIRVFKTTGDSYFGAEQNLSMELHRPMSFKHLKVLVFSRDLAQNTQYFLEILDGIKRDFLTNENVRLLITDSANELLEFTREPTVQQDIEGTLYSILVNNQDSNYFTPVTSSDFTRNIDLTGAAVIPIATFDDTIRIGGGAVFKDFRYIGDISHEENRDLNLLNNDFVNDQFDVEHHGYNLALMATEAKTTKRLVDRENLRIKFNIALEGHVLSHILDEEHEIDNQQILEELQVMAEERVKGDVDKFLNRIQKDLNTDIIFISDYLRKFHPNIWEQIEDDYDSIFPHIEFETEVEFSIRRRGLIQ